MSFDDDDDSEDFGFVRIPYFAFGVQLAPSLVYKFVPFGRVVK